MRHFYDYFISLTENYSFLFTCSGWQYSHFFDFIVLKGDINTNSVFKKQETDIYK